MEVLSAEIYQIQSRTRPKKEHPKFLSYLIIFIQLEIIFIERKWFLLPDGAHGHDDEHNIGIGIETFQLLNNNRYSSIASNSLQIYHICVLYFMYNATQW